MLSERKGNKLNKYVCDYCVFDLETTGCYPSDEVIEISAVKVLNGEVVDTYSSLVNPMRHIPAGASAVNHITDDMVKEAPYMETALADFLDFVGDMILVGHNIHSFDMRYICRDAEKLWGKTIGNDYIDTLSIARACLPGLSHYSLGDLACHYGIDTKGAHRALADCTMNQLIFEYLGKEMDNLSGSERAVPNCPKCGNMLKKRNGKYGEFWGCSRYPECRYTRNV